MYRLGLIACDFVPEELSEQFEDYPVMFADAIASAEVDVEWQVFRAYAGELPVTGDECDGYLITGSRAGTYDDEPWIAPTENFIRSLVGRTKPVAGLCFGHQLIAQALGGTVERSNKGWGIGIYPYEVLHQPDWMTPAMDSFIVPVCHQDQVMTLPSGAQHLARSGHCENFMLQFNDTMLGIQGHPEFDASYIKVLIDLREDRLDEKQAQAARESLSRSGDNVSIMVWISRFLGIQ